MLHSQEGKRKIPTLKNLRKGEIVSDHAGVNIVISSAKIKV